MSTSSSTTVNPVPWFDSLKNNLNGDSPIISTLTWFDNDYVLKYWATWTTEYWPVLQRWLSNDYMIPVISSIFAVLNMFIVVFKQGGLNSVAVIVSALKEVLKD